MMSGDIACMIINNNGLYIMIILCQVQTTLTFRMCYVSFHYREGHLNVVKYLVDQGASVSARNKFSRTPMDIARR